MSVLHSDSWLSNIIGYPAYKLTIDDALMACSPEELQTHLAPLRTQKAFAFTKVAVDNLPQVHFAEQLGFRLVDTNTFIEMPHTPSHQLTGNTEIRFATPADAEQTIEVARNNFVFSRFHADPLFDNAVANIIKGEWVNSYFQGKRGDGMVVAVKEGRIVGFLQLFYQGEVLLMDLMAVDLTLRRQGIAADMTIFSDHNCPPHQVVRLTTQLANVPAMRLYEKLGFRLLSSQYIFHYHHG